MFVILNKDISFLDFDHNLIFIPEGTEVFVDPDEQVAFYHEVHFSIRPHEYSPKLVANLNN